MPGITLVLIPITQRGCGLQRNLPQPTCWRAAPAAGSSTGGTWCWRISWDTSCCRRWRWTV